MTVHFIQTSQTNFRVRVEVSYGQQEGTHNKSLGIIFATDPPNVVEHYNKLVSSLMLEFPSSVIAIFELPGFALSKSSSKTLVQVVKSIRELILILRSNYMPVENLGLVMPCVSGLFTVPLMHSLPQGTLSFISVPQCGDYECEHEWANRVNSNGMLSIPIISRLINYIQMKSIAKTWYKAALPKHSTYSEITNNISSTSNETGESVSRAFSEITMSNFDQGGTFPLAYFLQLIFFWPYAADKLLISNLKTKEDRLEVPTLAVWGLQDRTHKAAAQRKDVAKSFQSYVKDGLFHIETIDKCAHFPELQFPDTFAKILSNFLLKFEINFKRW